MTAGLRALPRLNGSDAPVRSGGIAANPSLICVSMGEEQPRGEDADDADGDAGRQESWFGPDERVAELAAETEGGESTDHGADDLCRDERKDRCAVAAPDEGQRHRRGRVGQGESRFFFGRVLTGEPGHEDGDPRNGEESHRGIGSPEGQGDNEGRERSEKGGGTEFAHSVLQMGCGAPDNSGQIQASGERAEGAAPVTAES